MLMLSNTVSDTNTDDMANEQVKVVRRSSFLLRNFLWIAMSLIVFLILLISVSRMRNLPQGFLALIIISIIGICLFIGLRSRKLWIELKNLSGHLIKVKRMNTFSRVVFLTSIGLTVFIVLFSSSVITPYNFGYGSFGTFLLFVLLMSTVVWILTLIIYFLIVLIRFIWRKSSFLRQQLSAELVSYFLGSFLTYVFFLFILTMMANSPLVGFGLGLALALSVTLFIGGLTTIIFYRSKFTRIVSLLMCLMGCVGMIVLLWFYFIDGYEMKDNVIVPMERYPQNLSSDPSRNGNYSYSVLTYGSGVDRRIDYGIRASIRTRTIDLSSIIRISSINRKFFQMNESSIPLNGKIWYPTNSSGPSPVVVFLHGNHLSTESSEYGYEYLAIMLAKQGFLTVSIDENILNVSPSFSSTDYGKIAKIRQFSLGSRFGPEMMARALILLETLKEFRRWNEERTNPFFEQIDLFNIGLMGHSRAGEAIVIAYLFNQLKFLPDFPSDVRFSDYNFGIKALFSIGGTDDYYMPLGQALQFSDVTMFAIHGIYDGDLTEFLAQAKLTNLKFTSKSQEYHFKSSLYVHHANHGQFNRDWGKFDLISGVNHLMNARPLISMEKQEHICQIYMSALMNILLKNRTKLRILFEDYRSALSFLPSTNYFSTFQDSNELIIADFENSDVTQGTLNGSQINVTNLLLWSSVYVKVYRSSMLLVQPVDNSLGQYRIQLTNSINGSALRFLVGRTNEGLIDNCLVRVFYTNQTNESFIVRVLPPLTKQLFKITSRESVTAMQTISLPLQHSIIALEFLLNGTNAQFLIDNIVLVK